MQDNIGVGAIIGLVTASSIYVWNSDSFSKIQKTFLLLFLVFPPLQWVSILVALGYNKIQEQNSFENKSIKKENKHNNFDLAKINLNNLKESGIISTPEYEVKIEQIDSQQSEFDLLNSTEYKQLKQLLDSNILTRDEFETKIKLLKDKSFINTKNEIKIGENNTIINGGIIIPFEVKFIKSNYSFKFGDFKSWTIQFEDREILNFYTKISNSTYFISISNSVEFFNSREEFLIYAFKNS